MLRASDNTTLHPLSDRQEVYKQTVDSIYALVKHTPSPCLQYDRADNPNQAQSCSGSIQGSLDGAAVYRCICIQRLPIIISSSRGSRWRMVYLYIYRGFPVSWQTVDRCRFRSVYVDGMFMVTVRSPDWKQDPGMARRRFDI